jgi:hypothetical protein
MTDTTPLRIQTNTQVRLAPRVAKRSARLNTVTVHAAREAGLKPDGTSATGRKPIYDGSIGKWGEAKKCPACGERRYVQWSVVLRLPNPGTPCTAPLETHYS